MAKNIGYNRTIVEKLNVNGTLSEDLLTITYMDGKGEDAVEKEALLSDLLSPFGGWNVKFAISKEDKEELEVPYTEEELVLE